MEENVKTVFVSLILNVMANPDRHEYKICLYIIVSIVINDYFYLMGKGEIFQFLCQIPLIIGGRVSGTLRI